VSADRIVGLVAALNALDVFAHRLNDARSWCHIGRVDACQNIMMF